MIFDFLSFEKKSISNIRLFMATHVALLVYTIQIFQLYHYPSISKYIQVYPSISKYIQVYPSILSTSKYLVNLPLKLFFSFLHFKLTDYEYLYYYTLYEKEGKWYYHLNPVSVPLNKTHYANKRFK